MGTVLYEHTPNHVDFILGKIFMDSMRPTTPLPSIEQPPELKLKPLLTHLKYAYLEENRKLPMIIAN